jgi:hypothetical protein
MTCGKSETLFRLPGLQASAKRRNSKRCQHGGEARREMQHLDNLQVGELTAGVSLYPLWVRFKKVFDI